MFKTNKNLRSEIKQDRADLTVQTIIEAAVELAQKEGLSATTPTAIARKSGFSIGTVYRYFADRVSVFNAVVEYLLRTQHSSLIKKIDQFPDHGSCRQFVMLIVEHYETPLRRRNPKRVIPVYRNYIKSLAQPERFATHVDILIDPILHARNRNTSDSFGNFDAHALRQYLRAWLGMFNSGFLEEDPYFENPIYTLNVIDAMTKLLGKSV